MFRGVSNLNLYAKGRLAIPTRYREMLEQQCNGEMVITIDTDERCLLIYPRPDWEVIEAKVGAMSSFDPMTRRVQRLLIGHATDIELDSSGRLLLTPPLRAYAELDKRTVLLGQGRKLELWSEDRWIARRDSWLDNELGQVLPDDIKNLSL